MAVKPEPVSAIFPDEQSARTAERRLRAREVGVEAVYLLRPSDGSRELKALGDAVPAGDGLRRVLPASLVAGAVIGALVEGALVLLGLSWARGYVAETLILLLLGAFTAAGITVLWSRLALPPVLDPLRQALRHGHSVVVVVPHDPEQSRRARRIISDVLDVVPGAR
jgi:hypothetical protein